MESGKNYVDNVVILSGSENQECQPNIRLKSTMKYNSFGLRYFIFEYMLFKVLFVVYTLCKYTIYPLCTMSGLIFVGDTMTSQGQDIDYHVW